jgi:uncharacterized protein (DUF1778 family)
MSLNATVEFNVPATEIDLIDLAARVSGVSRSEFMLRSAAERAQEILLDGPTQREVPETDSHLELVDAARMVC